MGEVVEPALLNGRGAPSQWMNLGWWAETGVYAEAARALARQVGATARLGVGDHVLEVGCGAGDSLPLWIHEFGIARVTAIEPTPALAARARDRVDRWGLRDRVAIHESTAEAFDDPSVWSTVTAIVAVDAAYHIDTRRAWLHRLGGACRPGTKLALLDIALFDAGDRPAFAKRARQAGIPPANLWSVEEIAPTLQGAGFTCTEVRHCGEEVFGGFTRFVRRHALRFASYPRQGGWRALGTALMLASARRRLTAVLIGAERSVIPTAD